MSTLLDKQLQATHMVAILLVVMQLNQTGQESIEGLDQPMYELVNGVTAVNYENPDILAHFFSSYIDRL